MSINGIPSTGVVYIKPAAEREGNLDARLPEIIKAHASDLSRGAFITVDADKTRAREFAFVRERGFERTHDTVAPAEK